MKQSARRIITRCIPKRVREWCVREIPEFADVWNGVAKVSYSQQGEDLAIERYFKCRGDGFFVDVGAYHPVKFSNTWKLYCKGWTGINIDANPDAICLFQQQRPRDVNVHSGVSESGEKLTYYRFNEATLNTFDADHAKLWDSRDGFEIVEVVEVPTRRLSDILEEHLETSQTINLMSIDVEGFDLQVLRSNDWDKYRAELLLVEERLAVDQAPADNRIVSFLRAQGYNFWESSGGTLIFQDSKVEK